MLEKRRSEFQQSLLSKYLGVYKWENIQRKLLSLFIAVLAQIILFSLIIIPLLLGVIYVTESPFQISLEFINCKCGGGDPGCPIIDCWQIHQNNAFNYEAVNKAKKMKEIPSKSTIDKPEFSKTKPDLAFLPKYFERALPDLFATDDVRKWEPEIPEPGFVQWTEGIPDSQAPRLVYKVEPSFPEIPRQESIEAILILKLAIASDGHVAHVEILRSVHPLINKAAIDAVRQWCFEPAKIAGKPVSASLIITMEVYLQ